MTRFWPGQAKSVILRPDFDGEFEGGITAVLPKKGIVRLIEAAPPLQLKGPDGGIGRRARLKILLSKGSAGSIPVLGTPKTPTKVGVFTLLNFVNSCKLLRYEYARY